MAAYITRAPVCTVFACPPLDAAHVCEAPRRVRPKPDPVLSGQRSVWDFPRPAIAEPCTAHVRIEHSGLVVADTHASVCTFETSHPPSYYFPPDAIAPGVLRAAGGGSFCEWKGSASYWDVIVGSIVLPRVGWSYSDPSTDFAVLRDHVAFYAAPFDTCTVDGETVIPQPGSFYGGWITGDYAGPFKGIPGSMRW